MNGARGPAAGTSRGDPWVALALAAAAAFLLACLHQERLWDDGYHLYELCRRDGLPWWFTWHHPGYLPVARLLLALGPLGHPFHDVSLASSLPAGGAVGAVYLLARRLGVGALGAFAGALLLASSPALVFFGTLIELHALHAFAVAAGLLVVERAARRASRRTFPLWAAAAFLPAALTHLSAVTLGPGWLAFALHVRRRSADAGRGRPEPHMALAARLAPGLALAFGAAVLAAHLTYQRHIGRDGVGGSLAILAEFGEGLSAAYLHSEWWAPAPGLWLALGLGGLAALTPAGKNLLGPAGRAQLLLVALWLLPPFLFFAGWGVVTEGGYLAGSLPVLALGATRSADLARVAPRAAAVALWLVLADGFALGLRASTHALLEPRTELAAPERQARLSAIRAALPEGGLLLGLDPWHQPADIPFADVREIDLLFLAMKDLGEGSPLPDVLERLASAANSAVAAAERRGEPAVLDLAWRLVPLPPGDLANLATALDTRLTTDFHLTPFEAGGLPFAHLTKRH